MIRLKCPPQQPAILAAADRLIGKGVLGEERQHVADHQQLAGLLRALDHLLRVGRLSARSAFRRSTCLPAFSAAMATSHATPAAGRCRPCRRSDRPASRRVRRSVAMPVKSIFVPARAEVSLDRPPVAGQPSRSFSQGRDLHAADFWYQVMDHAHEADAGNADANRFHESRFPSSSKCRATAAGSVRLSSRKPEGSGSGSTLGYPLELNSRRGRKTESTPPHLGTCGASQPGKRRGKPRVLQNSPVRTASSAGQSAASAASPRRSRESGQIRRWRLPSARRRGCGC